MHLIHNTFYEYHEGGKVNVISLNFSQHVFALFHPTEGLFVPCFWECQYIEILPLWTN